MKIEKLLEGKIEKLLKDILSDLVDGPYKVEQNQEGNGIELVIEDGPDASRIVGKYGQTISAVSTIVNALARTQGHSGRIWVSVRNEAVNS